jgi:2-C-methyl-D-erythritol 2,4-cyclodiphosphate synthase
MRVGIGYDLHKLVEGRDLFLGGIKLSFTKGLAGHSDADVLLHAVCDALLGACGCMDIGVHFPDTDSQFKGISGADLTRRVLAIINKNRKMKVNIINLDTVIICDKPNISQYRKKITENVAGLLGIAVERVSVKAKTTEGTSPDTISVYAVVLLDIGD